MGHTKKYLQNRELSWLAFNMRCLDQATDKTVPLLERLNFLAIYQSNLAEFFRVRVGSLSDLSYVKKSVIDAKSGMTPAEQIAAIHETCHLQQTAYGEAFRAVEKQLAKEGIVRLEYDGLNEEQLAFVQQYAEANIIPFLVPQVVTAHHPFPHLDTGALYAVARLDAPNHTGKSDAAQNSGQLSLAILPVPSNCKRIIWLPGKGHSYILCEHIVEHIMQDVFSMYSVRQRNIICVTRNADLNLLEGLDEEADFLSHMKKILRMRKRLAPVRLETQRELPNTMGQFLKSRLGLNDEQCYVSPLPLDMGYAFELKGALEPKRAARLSYAPFEPQWPQILDRKTPVHEQLKRGDVLLSYPYDSMDVVLELVRESIKDPSVQSIRISLYRLDKSSRLADLLCQAAEHDKEVQIIFELRARFDESNNIEWAQRCQKAGCKVSYGYREFKTHSKVCLITRVKDGKTSYTTQIGTGNYNEKTARLYCDLNVLTANEGIGRDAEQFFRNSDLEVVSDSYKHLLVAPLQIKQTIFAQADKQIARVKEGKSGELFFRVNSVTDLEIIEKLAEASRAGVKITLLVRGICCLVPGIAGHTENIRVVSIVGRLLEHSRVYVFGPLDDEESEIYISSADLMTRNMDRRVEVACPIYDARIHAEIVQQLKLLLSDNVKLRELKSNRTYTPLGAQKKKWSKSHPNKAFVAINAQEELIAHASENHLPLPAQTGHFGMAERVKGFVARFKKA